MRNYLRGWLALVLCLVAGLWWMATGEVRAQENAGLFGTKLAEAEQSQDLFTFFHLARTGREDLPDHRAMVLFKPTGEAFRPLVTLAVVTDAQGLVEGMRLEVARTFIDNAAQGVFAADLVKSFLASAGGGGPKDKIAALAGEVQARAEGSGTTTNSQEPSAGYEVYAGKAPAQTISNPSGSVQASLQNKGAANQATLQITLSTGDLRR